MKYIFLIVAVLFLVGCSDDIVDVKNQNSVGKTVKVDGIVMDKYERGDISGFTIADETGERINIQSNEWPGKGEELTVKGILIKNAYAGYYIKKS